MRSLLALTADAYLRHNVGRLSASLAFYTLLSLAPLLVVVIAIAGVVFGREAAAGQIVWQIQDLVGREGAQAIQALLESANRPAAGMIATIAGLLTLCYAAGSVMAELRDALNTIWCVPVKEEPAGLAQLLALIRDRTVAFAMVVGIGFLLLASLVVSAALSAIGKYSEQFALPAAVLEVLNFTLSFGVITFLFALMYKVLPDLYIEWSDVLLGAIVTALLFTIGKTLISLYLGKAGIGSTFGAAGSLVILLIWVYYSAQIFFLGAEFTQAYAQVYGSRPCDHVGREVQIVPQMPDSAHVTL